MSKLPFESQVITGMSDEEWVALQEQAKQLYGSMPTTTETSPSDPSRTE